MAIITFLKEEEKPIGKTMSTLAIATYMAMEHNVRTLVVSTDYNQKAVQRCFWEEEKPKKVNFGIFGPNTKTLDSENGMKGLEKIIKSNKITPNLITDYTKVVFKERLEVLLGTENDDQEDLAKAYPEVIAAANQYYDRVAKKLGMGTNLKDSDQEVKPRIKEIVVKTNLAKNISSYLWAAVGVGLAFQESWDKFFNAKGFKKSTEQFFESLGDSARDFFKGDNSCLGKYSGKILLGTALLSSILGVVNVMSSSHKPSKLDSADIIEKDRKYVVN